MKIDEITKQSLLYDFYGALLTERQQDVMRLYHEENLTLAEIAEEFSISRQGVHDALKNAEKSLAHYEEKLGLVAKLLKSSEAAEKVEQMLDNICSDIEAGLLKQDSTVYRNMLEDTAVKLNEVKRMIYKLED